MSTKELGEHFDIHGGGLDLKFPHHENEIAQTCGATHGTFRRDLDAQRLPQHRQREDVEVARAISSPTREVLAKIKHPEVLRFFLLSSHYRGPMNYSPAQLDQAEAALTRMYLALRDMPVYGGELHTSTAATARIRRRHGRRLQYARSDRRAAGAGARDSTPSARRMARAPRPDSWRRNCARSVACSDFSVKIPASSCAARPPPWQWRSGWRACTAWTQRRGNRRADRGAHRGTQGEELGGIGPHPRRSWWRRA